MKRRAALLSRVQNCGDRQHPSATLSTARDRWDWPQAASLSPQGESSAFRGRSQDTHVPLKEAGSVPACCEGQQFSPISHLYLVPALGDRRRPDSCCFTQHRVEPAPLLVSPLGVTATQTAGLS